MARAQEQTPERADVIEAARRYVGTPFRWGGRSVKGIDCVGLPLVMAKDLAVYGWERLWNDRECHAYATIRRPGALRAKLNEFVAAGILRRIDKDALQPGDLALCFSGSNHEHHVAILGPPGWIIEAYSPPEDRRRGRVRETVLTPDIWNSIMTGYQFAGVA